MQSVSKKIPIGYVSIIDYDLGYDLLPEYWNKGIITESCRKVIDTVQDTLPFLTATHDVNNAASGEVMKKLGTKYQYTYVEQWQPKNIEVHFKLYQFNFSEDEDFVFMKYWDLYPNHYI